MAVISDDDLTRLALSADPEMALDDDAVSLWDLVDDDGAPQLLPEWYMPSPARGRPVFRGWRRRIIVTLVITFVAINAYGLCSTYGVVRFG